MILCVTSRRSQPHRVALQSGARLSTLTRANDEARRHGWTHLSRVAHRGVIPCTTSVRQLASSAGQDGSGKWTATLNLPSTDFPMRFNGSVREVEFQKRCTEDLYSWQLARPDDECTGRFVLHDGPPYANGPLHTGHAMNKILKDIINRYMVMKGYKVHYIPGWDCHGLPIELKSLQRMQKENEKARKRAKKAKKKQQPLDYGAGSPPHGTTNDGDSSLNVFTFTPSEIRNQSAAFAEEAIDMQKDDFVRWGVMGDWRNSYRTMDKEYEASQIGVFHSMFDRGLIYRGKKPVYWSPSSQTALAEAELEYVSNHVSKSVFVTFEMDDTSSHALLRQCTLSTFPASVHAVVWTTTPWTLPSNLALCINPSEEYSLVSDDSGGGKGRLLLLATPRVSELREKTGKPLPVVGTIQGGSLVSCKASHPFIRARTVPFLAGDHVHMDSGSGVVHTAPGHGHDDYHVCAAVGIEPLCPVDGKGFFTADAGASLEGKHIEREGTAAVLDQLRASGTLLHEEDYVHKYPYDWRTKKPVIIRTTEQWFATVGDLRESSLKGLEDVNMVPASGKARLESMIRGRNDWCISRQRSWGVPIPAFFDDDGEVLMNNDTIGHVQKLFAAHGSSCWWTLPTEELLPEPYRSDGRGWRPGTDTMDVWFDSGTSWSGVLATRGLGGVADVYLEGSDQHRGWFQSSLLTSVAATGQPPFKTVITHGFLLDEEGRKMSKSLGNVVEPDLVINGGKNKKQQPAYGADVLRLWVGSTDYSKDVAIGHNIIAKASETLRKLRNTARFLLGNLNDFCPSACSVDYDSLEDVDRYMLHLVTDFNDKVSKAYDEYAFSRVLSHLSHFTSADLSSFYLEMTKDRLYAEDKNSHSRRSCQTVLYALLEHLTAAMAPIVCHTAEDIYEHFPLAQGQSRHSSVFQRGWPVVNNERRQPGLATRWENLRNLRSGVFRIVELGRVTTEKFGSSMELDIHLVLPPALLSSSSTVFGVTESELCEMLLVSKCVFEEGAPSSIDEADAFAHQLNLRSADWGDEPPQFVFSGCCTLDVIGGGDKHLIGVLGRLSELHKCPRCWLRRSEEENELCQRCHHVCAC